ncbi:surface-adhesin E family protein [Geomonas subterranea]|uniref:surface-adhesin E family protein n=1 Tax=Geomonas subterranea TaxID=2847989 RepID=UPI001CD250C7|nr:surface-adhesin E family protein [Geomonas fuzhouensis]
MKKTSLIAAVVALHASAVLAADWKFYTMYETSKDNSMIVFYDKETVRLNKGVVKVWTKDIPDQEITQALEQNENELGKIFRGLNKKNYIPPYAKAKKLPNEELIAITAFEVAANSNYTSPSNTTLYEIICKERKFRQLSYASYRQDDLVQTSSTPTSWVDAPPDTGADVLIKLTCK